MKKYVFLAFLFLCIVSYGKNILPAYAAERTISPAETATLNQTLENMKAMLSQMQAQAGAIQTNSAPVPVLSSQDAASLQGTLTSLGSVLSELQSSSMIRGNTMTESQKTIMHSVLGGISTNLLSMKDTLAGVPVRTANLKKYASTGRASAPMTARISNRSASGNTIPVQSASPRTTFEMAQISMTAEWNKWGWPIGIGIIVIFLAWMWLRSGKKTKQIAAHNHQNVKKETMPRPLASANIKPNVPRDPPMGQQPSKSESRPALSPLSSVVTAQSAQASLSQKFQEQKKPTG